MKTDNKKLWNGEPWDENLISNFQRPSQKIRDDIYAMAREQAAAAKPSLVRRIVLSFRGRFSYAVWGVAASLLIATCVWFGALDRGSYDQYQASNEVNNMIDEAVSILNEPDFSPLTEQSGVDIDEAEIVVGLQTVIEEIASLENSLQLSYLF